jgi:gliding motility-associated-like protein
MLIFDRWGNLVYGTKDMNQPWDGKANFGKEPASQDIYIYSIKLIDYKATKHSYKGTVTLIK